VKRSGHDGFWLAATIFEGVGIFGGIVTSLLASETLHYWLSLAVSVSGILAALWTNRAKVARLDKELHELRQSFAWLKGAADAKDREIARLEGKLRK
jgi:hypothetical protein